MTPDEKAKHIQEAIRLTQLSIVIMHVALVLVLILFIGLIFSLMPRRYY